MKKNSLLALLALAVFAAPTFAADKKEAKASDKPAAEKPEGAGAPVEKKAADATRLLPFQGKVAAVDAAAKTFTIKNKDGRENVFAISEKTKIEKADGTAGAIDDIKADEVVRGTRTKAGEGKWDAVKVMLGAKPKKEGAAPATEAANAEKKP